MDYETAYKLLKKNVVKRYPELTKDEEIENIERIALLNGQLNEKQKERENRNNV